MEVMYFACKYEMEELTDSLDIELFRQGIYNNYD